MKYRISYILKTGVIKSKNFYTKREMEDFVLGIIDVSKKIRVLNKTTKEVYNV